MTIDKNEVLGYKIKNVIQWKENKTFDEWRFPWWGRE